MSAVINSENAFQQKFPFHQTLINYIIKNADVNHLKNLYQTCKYFYKSRPKYIIDDLILSDEADTIIFIYKPQNQNINSKGSQQKNLPLPTQIKKKQLFYHQALDREWTPPAKMFSQLKNLCIFNRIIFERQGSLKRWNSTKISCFAIKELSTCFSLTEKDFNILTKEKTIQNLKIQKVIYPNGNFMVVEDIVAAVPNAVNIRISVAHFSLQTFSQLCSFERKIKFQIFQLSNVLVSLDVNEFFEFFKSNAASKGKFAISFNTDALPKETAKKFEDDVKDRLSLWEIPKNQKPQIYFGKNKEN